MATVSEPSIIVVLIHGSWATGAPWTQEGSFLREQLPKHLARPVTFHRFDWSGVNSHTHRLRAANELRDLLRSSIDDNPTAIHFVIAHSHAGNIACYAMRDADVQRAVRGVICLATPFLHVEPHALPKNLLLAVALVLIGFAPFAGLYLFRAPQDPVVKYLAGSVVALALPILALLTWAAIRSRNSRLSWPDLWRGQRNPTCFIRNLAFPVLGADRLLAVRISSDEAAGALVASQFLVWLFRRTWSAFASGWEKVEGLRRALGPLFGLAIAGSAIAVWLGVLSEGGAAVTRGIAVGFLLVFGIATIAVGFVAYLILVLILLMHLPVGLDAVLASLNVQTAAEPTPPSQATIFHVAPAATEKMNVIRHSALYDDPDVVRFVASWIGGRLGRDPVSQRGAVEAAQVSPPQPGQTSLEVSVGRSLPRSN